MAQLAAQYFPDISARISMRRSLRVRIRECVDGDIYSIFVGDLSCDTPADKIVTSEQHIITTVPLE